MIALICEPEVSCMQELLTQTRERALSHGRIHCKACYFFRFTIRKQGSRQVCHTITGWNSWWMHLETAAVALFLARRRCFLRSAGSSMASRLGVGFFRLPLPLSPLLLGSALGSWLIPAGWVPEPEDLQGQHTGD